MTPQDLAHHIQTAVKSAIASGALELNPEDVPQQIVVERPKNPQHGDWATNVALQISKKLDLIHEPQQRYCYHLFNKSLV